jgi:hypothetical protein
MRNDSRSSLRSIWPSLLAWYYHALDDHSRHYAVRFNDHYVPLVSLPQTSSDLSNGRKTIDETSS